MTINHKFKHISAFLAKTNKDIGKNKKAKDYKCTTQKAILFCTFAERTHNNP